MDSRAASVAVIEKGEFLEHGRGGDAVKGGSMPQGTQDAFIVERRFNRCQHVASSPAVSLPHRSCLPLYQADGRKAKAGMRKWTEAVF